MDACRLELTLEVEWLWHALINVVLKWKSQIMSPFDWQCISLEVSIIIVLHWFIASPSPFSFLKDSPVSEVDSDVMIRGSENSPMFSSSTSDTDFYNSVLEDDSSCAVEPVSLSGPQDTPLEINVEDLFPDALSPDTDLNQTLQDFISNPNILNGVNLTFLQEEPEGFISDHGLQELSYLHSFPLTPWIFALNSFINSS